MGGVDTVNALPGVTGKTGSLTKNNSKLTVKKDAESKQAPRKKQPNQYTKRREEQQRRENKVKEQHSTNSASDNGQIDIDTHKSNKMKKKEPKRSQPVTNGNSSTAKETSTKCPTNNNSSKSRPGTNFVKSMEGDHLHSET